MLKQVVLKDLEKASWNSVNSPTFPLQEASISNRLPFPKGLKLYLAHAVEVCVS